MGWLRRSLAELYTLLHPERRLYLVETLAAPWARGRPEGPVCRLALPELTAELSQTGFGSIEVVYRFRDRAVIKAGW